MVMLAGVALAGDMHYKVYGVAHVSTELIDNGADSSIFVSSNTTRIGIKGEYETDVEQLTVVFKYESNANFNGESTNLLSTRDSWAGVKGDWGMLVWGRRSTPFKYVGYRAVNIFQERLGDYRNATAYWGAGGANWDDRVPDSIIYTSPKLGEMVIIDLQYVPEEGMDDSTFFSGSAVYDKDGIYFGVAYDTHGAAREPAYEDIGPDDAESSNGFRVAGRYTTGPLRVGALFQTISNVGGYENSDVTVFGGSVQYAATPEWLLKGHYFVMDPDMGDAEDIGANLVSIGVDYVLNEMASLYVSYSMMLNQDNAYYALYRGGHGQAYDWTGDDGEQFGENQTGLAVGMYAKW
jgi:predicted porin